MLAVVVVSERDSDGFSFEVTLLGMSCESRDFFATRGPLGDDAFEAPSASAPIDDVASGAVRFGRRKADDSSLSNGNFGALLLWTRVSRPGVADESADGRPLLSVVDVDETVADSGEVEAEFGAGKPDVGSGALLLSVDEVADELEEPEAEPESVGCANARPGVVANADPIPSATANAPTRPIGLS